MNSNDERPPEVVEAQLVDDGDISQHDGQTTGEGSAMPVQRLEVTDPKAAIKRIESYTELVKVRAEHIQKRRVLAVAYTNQHHWNDIEGHPYLNRGGALMLQRMFGVAERNRQVIKTWHEDELGKFYQYECTAIFDAGGEYDSIKALGTRNQRGKFFSTKKEVVRDDDGNPVMLKGKNGKEYPKRESVRKDLSEIDPGNIQKSAITNCTVNGIQALVALAGVSWDEVSDMTKGKVRRDNVQSVSYGSRGADGADGPATDPQCRMLYAKAKAAGGDECLNALCKHLNIPKLREGKDGQVNVLFNQVNAGVKFIEQWNAADGSARGAEGVVTKQEADRLAQGKDLLGISDEDWKEKWGNLPHLMKRSLFEKAIAWLNSQADK